MLYDQNSVDCQQSVDQDHNLEAIEICVSKSTEGFIGLRRDRK